MADHKDEAEGCALSLPWKQVDVVCVCVSVREKERKLMSLDISVYTLVCGVPHF